MKRPPEYQVWAQIKQRCFNPKCKRYSRYGGRGITMDPDWAASYEAFIRDVGKRPGKSYSIERADNDGHYVPGNVRWATKKDQNRNTSRNRLVSYKGKQVSVSELAERTGMDGRRAMDRLEAGADPKEYPVEHGTVYYEWQGENHKLSAWAKRLRKSYRMLYDRIHRLGWSVEEAFTT
jgi:hypothetical protein